MKFQKIMSVVNPALVHKAYGQGRRRGFLAVNMFQFLRTFAKQEVPGIVADPNGSMTVADLIRRLECVLTPGPRHDFGTEKEKKAALLQIINETAGTLDIPGIRLVDPKKPENQAPAANDNKEPICNECRHPTTAVCSHYGKPYKAQTH